MWPLVAGAVVLLVILAIALEGRRQRRIWGRGSGRSLTGAGLLELQRHLEPERKVEILIEDEEVDDATWSGDGLDPGGGAAREDPAGD